MKTDARTISSDDVNRWYFFEIPVSKGPIQVVSPRISFVKTVFISGPYRAPTYGEVDRNIKRAEAAAKRLWAKGYDVVFCPHLNTAHFDGIVPEGKFLDACLIMLKSGFWTDLYLLKGWENSIGAQEEYMLAKHLGMRIIKEEDNEGDLFQGMAS